MILIEPEKQQHAEDTSELIEAGIFTWVVESNLIYGDSLVASLFGLDPGNAAKGLPFEEYFARVHQEDRAVTKSLIKQAILDASRIKQSIDLWTPRGPIAGRLLWGGVFKTQTQCRCSSPA